MKNPFRIEKKARYRINYVFAGMTEAGPRIATKCIPLNTVAQLQIFRYKFDNLIYHYYIAGIYKHYKEI